MTWIQASALNELLDLKAQHPEAKLVVGNTEIGKGAGWPWASLPSSAPVAVCPLHMWSNNTSSKGCPEYSLNSLLTVLRKH